LVSFNEFKLIESIATEEALLLVVVVAVVVDSGSIGIDPLVDVEKDEEVFISFLLFDINFCVFCNAIIAPTPARNLARVDKLFVSFILIPTFKTAVGIVSSSS
jgi:hypothetical protein